MRTQSTKPCTHPPTRIFAWFANGVLCVGCCDCGEVLAGAAEPLPDPAVLALEGRPIPESWRRKGPEDTDDE